MPSLRTPLKRRTHTRINQAAIDAWKVGDEDALHAALGITPGLAFKCTPLPGEIFHFGATSDSEPQGAAEALRLQKELVEAAGCWPDCRAELRARIDDLAEDLRCDEKRHADIVEHFKTGKHIVPLTTHSDSELRNLEARLASDRKHMESARGVAHRGGGAWRGQVDDAMISLWAPIAAWAVTAGEILERPNACAQTLDEIRDRLAERGLSLKQA